MGWTIIAGTNDERSRSYVIVEDPADTRIARIADLDAGEASPPQYLDSILAMSGPWYRLDPPRELTAAELAGLDFSPSPKGWDERLVEGLERLAEIG